MAQHKCGTCLHFEEGGIAGTGWCRHPLRQDIQNVVLVRRNELACRDGWSGDLWESRTGQVATAAPATPAITGHANGSKSPAMTNQHTDQVTTIGISPSRPKAAEPAVPSRGEEVVRPGAGSSNGKIEPPLPNSNPGAIPARVWGALESRSARIDTRVGIGQALGGSDSANRVAATASRSSPLRSDASPPRMRLSLDGPPAETRRPRDPSDDPHVPRPEPRFGARPEPWSAASFAQGASRSGETEPFPVARPTAHFQIPLQENQPAIQRSPGPERGPVEAPTREQPSHPESTSVAGQIPARRAHVPISERITQLPHICMTCRDFRPVNGGERGWCNNRFAFEERREVSRDGIACQSTIGDWWTAADDWWLQQADISHHGRPTPQFNELLHELLLRRRDGRA